MLVIGSSLQVIPASRLVLATKQNNGCITCMNFSDNSSKAKIQLKPKAPSHVSCLFSFVIDTLINLLYVFKETKMYNDLDEGDSISKIMAEDEKLVTILREHWEHSRYCEYELLWFTNIYAIVVAAVLAFMSRLPPTSDPAVLPFFLSLFALIFSVFGFMIAISQSLGHKNHLMNVLVILNYWEKTGFHKDPEKPFHFKTVYIWFYAAAIIFFAVLSGFNLRLILLELIILGIMVFIVIFIFYLSICRKEFKKRNVFLKTLRKTKESIYHPDWDHWFEDKEIWREIKKQAKNKNMDEVLAETLIKTVGVIRFIQFLK
jgi:hypothetical protein